MKEGIKMEFVNYVVKQAIVLIPALIAIGAILKATPKIPNWLIPYILLACGIGGAIGIMGVSINAAIQGILVTGVSVYGYEAFKALREGTEKKDV